MDEFLNNFYVQIPIHGYDISLSKKVSLNKHNKFCFYQNKLKILQPYLKNLMNKLRDFIFANATTTFERADRRIIMNSDLFYVYPIEKWIQKQVAVSQKNTFYHV